MMMRFNEFKKQYEYDLMGEIYILKKLPLKTFNKEVSENAKLSLKRITYASRPKVDRDFIVKVEYISYLENFLIYDISNFDLLYDLMKSKQILIDDLRELNRKKRRQSNKY